MALLDLNQSHASINIKALLYVFIKVKMSLFSKISLTPLQKLTKAIQHYSADSTD